MERGWETPELLARAAAARTALVEARVGGTWWHDTTDGGLEDGQRYALVLPVEQGFAGESTTLDAAASVAMLGRALAEYPAERVVVLSPSGALAPALRDRLSPTPRGAAPSSSMGRAIRGRSSIAPVVCTALAASWGCWRCSPASR